MEAVGNELIFRTACKSTAMDQTGARDLLQRLDDILDSVVCAPDSPTIDLSGKQARICGLPAFELREGPVWTILGSNL